VRLVLDERGVDPLGTLAAILADHRRCSLVSHRSSAV
jgi:hypothetical protein